MLRPFQSLARSLRERGWKGTITQMYLIGDIKFGVLKGTDKFGNKYYEDINQPYGQHRWIEYADIHNYDASMIQPEWHGWMHHMFDETPNDPPMIQDSVPTSTVTHNTFTNHVGMISPTKAVDRASVDLSQYRHRGYKVGSLMIGKDDPELYYKQPGHPLSPAAKKGGRHQPEEDGPFATKDEMTPRFTLD